MLKPKFLAERAQENAALLHKILLDQRGTHSFWVLLLVVSSMYLATSIHPQSIATHSWLWILGAISFSASYSFGLIGLCSSLVACVLLYHTQGYPSGISGVLSSLLYISSVTLMMLLPYYRQDNESISKQILADSGETVSFVSLSILSSFVSIGIYILCLKLGRYALPLSIETLASLTLYSSLTLVSTVPLFVIWKRKSQWPALPRDPKEYTAWTISLIIISFIALAFGRNWLALSALLVVWATARFSWFGACLAITITTIFVSPQVLETAWLPSENISPFSAWAVAHMEALSWFVLITTSFYFASLLADRRKVERNLEHRVRERTLALDHINTTLKDEIDHRHHVEADLQKSNQRYKALIETAGIPVIVLSEYFRIEHWNRACEASTGLCYSQMLGHDFLRHCIPANEHESLVWRLNKASKSGTNQENVETHILTASGKLLSMLWNINHIRDESLDEHGQYLLIGQDISKIRQTQNQLHYLAHFDSLTGVANRRLFEDRCKQSIETAKRYNSKVALLSIDIDHFKKINDSLGHDAGDDLLVHLAKRLQKCVRKEDTVARLGGDEFAILLPNITGQDGADFVARNILDSITQSITIKNTELVITSSIGITISPDDSAAYEGLLKNADMAMYRAKNAGRNNIQFYCPEMNDEMQRQIQVEADLRNGLSGQQFELYYQPIVDTKSGELVALEALMRWHHPTQGTILPDEFINIADQTGLLQQIGEWAINQLCLEASQLEQHHHQALPIAFNLTRRQYHHPGLLKMLSAACDKHDFNPKKLILELSEATITQLNSDSSKILRSLKRFGSAITIDGFGTGSSSLKQLNELPIDIIKVDRSFVKNCLKEKKDRMIVETVLAISKQMGVKTYASGVETPAQEAFLQQRGCHYAQGFLYSEALALAPLCDFLKCLGNGHSLHSGDQITLPFGQALVTD